MDREAVERALRDVERETAVGWCGASAADDPVTRLRALMREMEQEDGGGYELTVPSLSRPSHTLLVRLSRRYGLTPMRRKGQRRNTVILVGSRTFLDKVLWPMFEKQSRILVEGADCWVGSVLDAALENGGA